MIKPAMFWLDRISGCENQKMFSAFILSLLLSKRKAKEG